MLLVGGLDAWKQEFDDGVNRGVSSSGSLTPVLNGGISSSSSSSSARFTSPPYVRNRSGTESSLSSSFTSSDLGALNESPRLPPSTESSPGLSYPLAQPPEKANGFGSNSELLNRQATVNGHPPHRTDLVCVSFILLPLELIAEARLGHARLRKWNHIHSIPLIPQTRRHVYFLHASSPLYSCDQRARVTPDRVHQPVSFLTEEERLPRPNPRGFIHSFISTCRLPGSVIELCSSTPSCGGRSCVGEAREPAASPTSRPLVLLDRTKTANDSLGLSSYILVRCTDRNFRSEEPREHVLYEFYDPMPECDGTVFQIFHRFVEIWTGSLRIH